MAKIFLLMFVWGPALVGFALGWLIRHPRDWSGPAVVAPLGLLVTALTYRWGLRRLPNVPGELKPVFVAAMIGSALVGVVIFAMLVFGIIG